MAAHAMALPWPQLRWAGFAGWRENRIVLLLGMGLTLLVVAAVAWVGAIAYQSTIDVALEDQALKARVLEHHATLSIDTASLALSSLADRVAARPGLAAGELEGLLREALAGLPIIRGVAVVDAQGVVLASTSPAERQRRTVPLAVLGAWPKPGQDRLGALVPGRSLADIGRSGSAPAGVGFIPLLRTSTGGNALFVALLNPDAFSNYQTLALADPRACAAMLRYDGDVLAATAGAGMAPGERIANLPRFREQLAQRAHGASVGAGLGVGPQEQVAAYRASPTWPLVIVVERPLAAVRADWWRAARQVVWVLGAAVVLLVTMTLVAWRGLQARERTRRLLQRAQAVVAQRERELSVTVKSVQELIFRTDLQGRITYVNARWSAVGGTEPRQAVGLELASLAVPEQRAMVQALFAADDRAGTRNAQVCVRTPASGGTRVFDLAVVPLIQDEQLVGFAGSAAEVTERVTAQRRLQTQLQITELMLEASPLPLSVRDLQGCYLSVNQAWEAFTGIRRQEVLGRASAPHLTAAQLDRLRAQERELVAKGGRMRHEAEFTHADGSCRDVVLEQVLMPGDNGAPAAILAVLMDVSEFRAAERATREARDAAEEASRAKSEFIANISHELRTPLQSILGFSELGTMRGRDQPKLAAMFSDIHTSGRRMLALVNDLLDVAKIESSVGTFHLERADLRPLVQEVLRELEPQLGERGLRIAMALHPVPQIAKVDPRRFQQVVRNILANAIRFSPPQGTISVDSRTTPESEIVLRIADQGPGIPPAELERIFDAFVQSSATKDGSGGTGLGLTISRKILEVHGGRISAANQAAGGVAFSVALPARSMAETIQAPL